MKRKSYLRACMHVCVPVIAIHLPLCADMGCFSAVTQCSFYPVPLAVSPLSLSSSFSLVTQLPAQSDVSNHLLSNTLALLGEAVLLSPPPASSRLMFTPFSSAPSLPYTFIILFATVTLYISSLRFHIFPFTSPFFVMLLFNLTCSPPLVYLCHLCHFMAVFASVLENWVNIKAGLESWMADWTWRDVWNKIQTMNAFFSLNPWEPKP